jgi:HEAT repeat protein
MEPAHCTATALRRFWLPLLGACVVGMWMDAWTAEPRRYEGRTAEEWFKEYRGTNGLLRHQAETALYQLGDEVAPLLTAPLERSLSGEPEPASDATPSARWRDPLGNQFDSLRMLRNLGTSASSAQPVLIRFAREQNKILAAQPDPSTWTTEQKRQYSMMKTIIGMPNDTNRVERWLREPGMMVIPAVQAIGAVGGNDKELVLVLLEVATNKRMAPYHELLGAIDHNPRLTGFPAMRPNPAIRIEHLPETPNLLPAYLSALPELIAAAQRPETRLVSIAMLRHTAAFKPEVVPVLKQALDDPDPAIRRLANEGISKAAQGSGDAVLLLLPQIGNSDPKVRERAFEGLSKASAHYDQIVPALIRGLAADDLQGMTTLPREVGIYFRSVSSNAYSIRASRALAMLNRQTPLVLPALQRALRDDNPRVRAGAAGTAEMLREAARDMIPELERLAKSDPELAVRYHAANSLWHVGRQHLPLVPFIIMDLKSEKEQTRTSAAMALGAPSQNAHQVVPPLCEVLAGDPSAKVRQWAAKSLGRHANKAALPALQAALKDESPEVRKAVEEAIKLVEAGVPAGAAGAPLR